MDDVLSINNVPSKAIPNLGEHGEAIAAGYLIKNGYRIVVANFKVPVGRNSKGVSVTGEIDIIALDGETLCFVEVKTRRSDEFTPIITNVDVRKQRQITRTAKIYRRIFGVWDMEFRYDVVTVLMPKNAKPQIELTRDFWNESKFRKRTWNDRSWNEFL
ncbi:MAG: YraN family protein [Chloracidobacterium sp.]|nr:YraN family protein [Chloracidobacterium sp.]